MELKNTATGTIDLSGFYFADGITYTFPAGSSINAGAFIVLAADTTAFKQKYPGVSFFDQYIDTLSNKGERIRLAAPAPIDTFISITYNDDLPWPILADGNDYSLVPIDNNPTNNQKDAEDWRASAIQCGSPGVDDGIPPVFPEIIVTEVLSHTDPPEYDAVEIFNASVSAVDISGWFISDNRNDPMRYIIPQGTIINTGEYLVFDEFDFNADTNGFVFNRTGDHALLFSANADSVLTGYAAGYEFGAQYNGVSFGRWVNSLGDVHFVAQPQTSLGMANDSPKVGPVVVTHINYKPLSGTPPAPSHEEYLVLQNITDTVVNLFYEHWDGTFTDTVWQVKGIGFEFPENVSLQPKEYVILTDTTPTYFRSENAIPTFIKVYQYPGSLSNKSDNIRVMAPERRDTLPSGVIYTPYVLIDQVDYKDTIPWPIYADEGAGYRLDRIVDNHYGNDPANWGESSGGLFNFLPLSINDLHHATDVLVYPNPTSEVLNFNGAKELVSIKLYSVDGRLILQTFPGDLNASISVATLSSGVYFYQVNLENRQITGKVIIE